MDRGDPREALPLADNCEWLLQGNEAAAAAVPRVEGLSQKVLQLQRQSEDQMRQIALLEQQLQQAKQDVAVSGRISSSLAAAAAAPYADCSGSYLGRLRVKRTGASPGPSTIGDSV